MWIVSTLVTVLLLIGFLLISDISVGGVKNRLISGRDFAVQTVQDARRNRKYPIQKKLALVTGKQKVNFLVRNFSEAQEILSHTGRSKQIKAVNIAAVCMGLAGLAVSLWLDNLFLAPTLCVGLALLPVWYIHLTENFLKKYLNAELEVALSTITTSYVRSESLIQAVEENLKYLNSPVKQVFSRFVNENRLIDSNVIAGLQRMKMGLDSRVFHEWCDAMIQCQNDRTLKATLFPIVNKFSEMKSIQEELDTLLLAPIRDFLTVALIVLLSIPMMYLLNKEWFRALIGTVGGKMILSFVSLCFFYGLNRAITLSKPIEYRR